MNVKYYKKQSVGVLFVIGKSTPAKREETERKEGTVNVRTDKPVIHFRSVIINSTEKCNLCVSLDISQSLAVKLYCQIPV